MPVEMYIMYIINLALRISYLKVRSSFYSTTVIVKLATLLEARELILKYTNHIHESDVHCMFF